MKKFYVGIKALLSTSEGVLLLKHATGYWDLPGGRIDDDEDFEVTLAREISEELPGATLIKVVQQLSAYRVDKNFEDGTGLVIVTYVCEAYIPEVVLLSDEHKEYLFVKKIEDIPTENINPHMRSLIFEAVEKL